MCAQNEFLITYELQKHKAVQAGCPADWITDRLQLLSSPAVCNYPDPGMKAQGPDSKPQQRPAITLAWVLAIGCRIPWFGEWSQL